MSVRWLQVALRNLGDIADYIAEDSPERSVTFVREIRQRTNLLLDFPSVGRAGRVIGTRELVVHKNYIVVYRMKSGHVEILRVWHVAQKHANNI
jgi:toxin ParE1/3/4